MDNEIVSERVVAVETALAPMQRHDWELGVAARAMLELGIAHESAASILSTTIFAR
jgi:hypothetical protein